MTAVRTYQVGREICEALGLPTGCVSAVDLRFHAGESVTATVEFAPDRDQLGKVMSVIKRYELHEKTCPHGATLDEKCAPCEHVSDLMGRS